MKQASANREEELLSLLNDNPNLPVSSMSKILQVSEVTVRKILSRLENRGTILRSHGGAAPAFHPDIVARQNWKSEEKTRIAKAAAAMIGDGDTVMINSSTTAVLIARYLIGRRGVRIVTNSTLILPFARMNPQLSVTLVGADFRPATEALVGPLAITMLENYHAKLAFIGTAGFGIKNGISAHVPEEASVVKKITERAEKIILVADSSKYNKTGFFCFLRITDIDKVITDTGLDDTAKSELEEAGVEVVRV